MARRGGQRAEIWLGVLVIVCAGLLLWGYFWLTGQPLGQRGYSAVVVFGEDPYAEYEGDRETLSFSARNPEPLALLRGLRGQGIPVVSVFLSGRPLWVNPELDASGAFVAAWLPGTEGAGVADVLFRDASGAVNVDFTGKLSFSWPRRPDQTPLNRGDAGADPLFPYGFGLTYADPSR